MSRTYRRKRGDLTDVKRQLEDTINYENFDDNIMEMRGQIIDGWYYDCRYNFRPEPVKYVDIIYKQHSKQGIKRINRFHADGKKVWCKAWWRGPMWFYREFCQVPYRQRARQEILKFMRNHDYEVVLESKPKSQYWD